MMKDAYKAVIRTAGFLLCVSLLSLVIVHPYYGRNMKGSIFQDTPVRKQLSGTLDFLFVGSSHTRSGFNPEIMDEALGVNSYNLSIMGVSLCSRQYLLEKEMKRNPVDTVIIDISYDLLTHSRKTENVERVLWTLANLDNYRERFHYLFSIIRLDEYGEIYYQSLLYGVQCWKKLLHNELVEYTETKNYVGRDAKDLTISQEDFNKFYRSSHWGAYQPDSCKTLEEMIAFSQERGARVVLVVIPISDRTLLHYRDNEVLDCYLKELSDRYQCECYNFNLLKDKSRLFLDQNAFFDGTHLSRFGAETFTSALADVLCSDAPEDYFWDSHEQAQENNEYLRPLLESYVKS